MSRLTVTEKEHWKSRIENRIKKAIELLESKEPGLMPTIEAEAKQRAYKALGILEHMEKIQEIDDNFRQLRKQREELSSLMKNIALKNQFIQCDQEYHIEYRFNALVEKYTARCEQELLSASPFGTEILSLRAEKEALLDTVWLATSSVQIRELWTRVSSVIGDESTELQQRILASATDEQKPE